MKAWAARWGKALWQSLKTPTGAVALVLAVVVFFAILSTINYKGGETMQISVRTDVLRIRTAGPLSLAPLLARTVTLVAAKTVTVPGEPERTLRSGDTCFIEDAPPLVGAAQARPSPARLSLQFGAAQEIEFLRQRESKEPSYYTVRVDPTVATAPAESSATMTLQAGQQVRLNGDVIYQSARGGQVKVVGDHGFQVVFSATQPDTSRLVPTAIVGLGFLRGMTGPSDPDAAQESGLLGGELTFLNMPGESVNLRQGANLILEGLDATLQSVSLADDTVIANVSGEVDRASLQVGHTRRVVQPTWFDVVLSSRLGRAIIGVIAVLVGLLTNIEKLHMHARKATRDRNETNRNKTAEE